MYLYTFTASLYLMKSTLRYGYPYKDLAMVIFFCESTVLVASWLLVTRIPAPLNKQ